MMSELEKLDLLKFTTNSRQYKILRIKYIIRNEKYSKYFMGDKWRKHKCWKLLRDKQYKIKEVI